MIFILGFRCLIAVPIPEINPPPPIGITRASKCSIWLISSSPIVPCPEMTRASWLKWTLQYHLMSHKLWVIKNWWVSVPWMNHFGAELSDQFRSFCLSSCVIRCAKVNLTRISFNRSHLHLWSSLSRVHTHLFLSERPMNHFIWLIPLVQQHGNLFRLVWQPKREPVRDFRLNHSRLLWYLHPVVELSSMHPLPWNFQFFEDVHSLNRVDAQKFYSESHSLRIAQYWISTTDFTLYSRVQCW